MQNKRLITCINFFTHTGILLTFYRIVVRKKDSAITKTITDANPGSDYDQVYRNNFDENFSINPKNTFKSMMEKLKNEHHATVFWSAPDMIKHQLYQSCEESIFLACV